MAERVALLAPLAAATLWGGMYVVSEWSFDAVPPVTLGFLRVAVGVLALLAVVRLTRPSRSFDRREVARFGLLGLWVTLTIVTQFVGTDLTTAGQGSLLTVATPVATVLLGAALLAERLTRRRLAGIALAAVGTLVVLHGQYGLGSLGGASLLGVAALLVASVTWGAYTVQGAPLVRRYSALEMATYATLAAVPMLGVAAAAELLVLGRSLASIPVTPEVVGAVAYLGLGATAAAWYLWYKGLEYVDAGRVAVAFYAQPLVGVGLGALLLDERVGPTFLLGGAVLAGGVYLANTG